MNKRVNIYPRSPIIGINPPIRVPVKNVFKPIQDIRVCILAGAKVEEILANGKIVLLNLRNYDMDNNAAIKVIESEKPAIASATPSKLNSNPMQIETSAASPVQDIKEEIPEENKVDEELEMVDVDEAVNNAEVITEQQHLSKKQLKKLRREQQQAAASKTQEAFESASEVTENPEENVN